MPCALSLTHLRGPAGRSLKRISGSAGRGTRSPVLGIGRAPRGAGAYTELRMTDVLTELRSACAEVATRARHVRIDRDAIPACAQSLPLERRPEPQPPAEDREQTAAFWLTLDTINFGSGWFPTLRKREGHSGYHTIAAGLRER